MQFHFLRKLMENRKVQVVVMATIFSTMCIYHIYSSMSSAIIQLEQTEHSSKEAAADSEIITIRPALLNKPPNSMSTTKTIKTSTLALDKTEPTMDSQQTYFNERPDLSLYPTNVNQQEVDTSSNVTSQREIVTNYNTDGTDMVDIHSTYDKDIDSKHDKTFRDSVCTLSKSSLLTHIPSDKMKLKFLPKYNLGIKFVAKVGTTFMIQALAILTTGVGKSNDVFSTSRHKLHNKRLRYLERTFDSASIRNVTAVIFSRNPFSRLFSAFIDKLYILNNVELTWQVHRFSMRHRNGVTRTNTCLLNVTFKDFLQYALYSPTKSLYDHYSPITKELSMPVLCNAKDIVVVKQETFSSDIEYLLNKIRVDKKEMAVLNNALHSERSKTTIEGIVKTVFMKARLIIRKMSCLTWGGISKRLWTSFQIQGYIHEKSSYPRDKFSLHKNGLSNPKYFIEIAMDEIRRNPVTHEQSIYQRKLALINAWKDIDQEDITKLLRIYKIDFQLFQYDKETPHF